MLVLELIKWEKSAFSLKSSKIIRNNNEVWKIPRVAVRTIWRPDIRTKKVNATATRRELPAGGLAGARREGRSGCVSAKHARLRLRLPSRRRTARARARAEDRPAVRLFRGPVSISPLASVSSRRSRPRPRSRLPGDPPRPLSRSGFRGAEPRPSFRSRVERGERSDSTKEFSILRRIHAPAR